MANPEHLAILKKGVEYWNRWRAVNRDVVPNLSGDEGCLPNPTGTINSIPFSRPIHSFSVVAALLIAALVTSDCLANCMACWWLKGVRIILKDGRRIEGYAKWNQMWAEMGYLFSSEKGQASRKQALKNKKQFPEVIFDPRARIDGITVYTHLRSIKYPVKNALVATREPIGVSVKEIQDLKLNPGPHDGYQGATRLEVVSPRIADLLQTKPVASCCYDESVADVCWVSYDKSFPVKALQRLCKQNESEPVILKLLKARDIFYLYFYYD